MNHPKAKLISVLAFSFVSLALITTPAVTQQDPQQPAHNPQHQTQNQPQGQPTPTPHPSPHPTPHPTAEPTADPGPRPTPHPSPHPSPNSTPHPSGESGGNLPTNPEADPHPPQPSHSPKVDPTLGPSPYPTCLECPDPAPPAPGPARNYGDDPGKSLIRPVGRPRPPQCPAGTQQLAPEFQNIAGFLQQRQGIDLGCAITPPTGSGPQLSRYQLFRSKADPNILNSAEWHSDDNCVYVAYTPTTSPVWYNTDNANENNASARVRPDSVGTFKDLKDINTKGNWPSSSSAYGNPNQGPAPRWLEICGVGDPQSWPATEVKRNTSLWKNPRSGSYCYNSALEDIVSIPGGPPAWHTLMPSDYRGKSQQRLLGGRIAAWDDIMNLMQDRSAGTPDQPGNDPSRAQQILAWDGQYTRWNVYSNRRVPWFPSTAEGIVANSFLAGEDARQAHMDAPPDYWLGSRPPLPSTQGCGTLWAKNSMCNNWDLYVKLDPEYLFMLADDGSQSASGSGDKGQGNFNNTLRGNLEVEMEQWLWPMGYRPDPGDRIYMVGRWVIDCGHNNWAAELHPLEMYVSSHIESVTRVAKNSTVDGPFMKVAYAEPQSQRSQLAALVVVTDAWPGGTLEFDIWPPPRPSGNAKLKSTTIVARDSQSQEVKLGLTVTESRRPASNPNRVHVTVTSTQARAAIRTMDLNDVAYLFEKGVRRYVARYTLWWDTSVGPDANTPPATLQKRADPAPQPTPHPKPGA